MILLLFLALPVFLARLAGEEHSAAVVGSYQEDENKGNFYRWLEASKKNHFCSDLEPQICLGAGTSIVPFIGSPRPFMGTGSSVREEVTWARSSRPWQSLVKAGRDCCKGLLKPARCLS